MPVIYINAVMLLTHLDLENSYFIILIVIEMIIANCKQLCFSIMKLDDTKQCNLIMVYYV